MNFVEHLIIGGGISGCLMARHLSERQLDFKLIEAQSSLGGRIQSTVQGFDLGPTWFWPHQQSVQSLLDELSIESFDQYSQGDYVYQQGPNSPINRGNDQQPMLSHRVKGGMSAIITALQNSLPTNNILLNTPVKQINKNSKVWTVQLSDNESLSCTHLWLAMPPRMIAPLFLAAQTRVLSQDLITHLETQQTWMSAQAKFVAVYEKPFWRAAGLSGQGFSRVGPMVEMNDASGIDSDSPAAIFGFIGVPALTRQSIDEQQIIDACVAQLGKLFGAEALSPLSTHYEDWANNTYISSPADINEPSQHAHFDHSKFEAELHHLNLGLIGSEFSKSEPGYIAGAIEHVNDKALNL
jgi:monoamine oxidase